MGLASKLAAAGGPAVAGAMMGAPMGGAPQPYPGGPAPSAPPYPPPGGMPPQQGMPGSAPYPPPGGMPQQGMPGAPGAAPYPPPGGAPPPYPTGAPGMPPGMNAPGAHPAGGAPYGAPPAPGGPMPGGAPYGAPPPMGGAPNPYGAPPPMGGGMPGAYPGAPGGMPGAPGGPAAAPPMLSGPPGGMAGALMTKLSTIVQANGLQRFYPPQTLQSLVARLDSRVNFGDLAARWRMPKELALDLASLALYDIVMFVDDSGSMAFEEGGERIDDLKLIAGKVAEVATLFDDDGILMRFMNTTQEGNGLRSPGDVAGLLQQVQYCGTTPLAGSLVSKVLQPIVYRMADSGQLQKPVLIISITDGEPTDTPKDMVVQVIKDARQRLQAYGPKAVAFEFAQVGKDASACKFLERLDKDPVVGSSIDCTSYFELEQAEYQKRGVNLSPEAWLVKMMVGAVDPSYDEGDE